MIILAFALLLSGQSTALPLPADAAAVPVQQAAPDALESTQSNGTAAEERRAGRRLICRDEPVLGSRFPVRRCRPADLTPEERALAADQLRRQQTVTMNGD
ncbi:hypothetical protein [Brevundimonas sp.]|jgi:hypothetical protein|uniref:hypothetical protein n=1 Tax=Brevundimonas sp. TaxID=1871086 RepID=UPI0017D5AB3B|nr:hypothetical protein [Brevundimonas sp.]MBA4807823.1 hypothetical protein [Brevundimonas sp.]